MRLGGARAFLFAAATLSLASTFAFAFASGCSLLFDPSNGDGNPSSPTNDASSSPSPAIADGGGELSDGRAGDGPSLSAADADAGELAGLVLHFAFEDLSGNMVKDLSGKGNDGTVLNGPTLGPGAAGHGQGIVTDGVNDRVRVSSLDGVRFPQSGTLSFWAKPASFEGEWILDQYDPTRDHIYVRLRDAEDASPNRLEAVFQRAQPEPASAFFVAFVPLTVGQWIHIVVIWDTQLHKASFYANNTLIETQSIPSTWLPKDELFELFRPGCCGSFPGTFDDLRLYDRPLSPPEVAQIP